MSPTTLEYTANALASMADCYLPDSDNSAGAALLLSVQSAVNELEMPDVDSGSDASDFADEISEIADSAPDVYTHQRWAEFVDLGAYREDPTEFGPIEDMEQAAGVCLYIIAERLAQQLVTERLSLIVDQCEDCTDESECIEHTTTLHV